MLKNISIKTEEKFFEKFNELKGHFETNGKCFEKMIDLLETNLLKDINPGSKDIIENVQHNINEINESFKSLIKINVGIENRVRDSLKKELNSNEATISNLNIQIEELNKQINELQNKNDALLKENKKLKSELNMVNKKLNSDDMLKAEMNEIKSIISKFKLSNNAKD